MKPDPKEKLKAYQRKELYYRHRLICGMAATLMSEADLIYESAVTMAIAIDQEVRERLGMGDPE